MLLSGVLVMVLVLLERLLLGLVALLLLDRHLLISTIGVLFINICSPVDLLTAFLFFLAVVGGNGGVLILLLDF
jgi:hypothetical protein